MPPYKKATSKSQQKKFFALAEEGKMSMADAKGKARKGKAYDAMPVKKHKRYQRSG